MRTGTVMRTTVRRGSVVLVLGLLSAACEEDIPRGAPRGAASMEKGGAKAAADIPLEDEKKNLLKDSDFVESEGNRDPFRSYAEIFRPKGPAVAQRAVLMPNTEIDKLRLIAIITGIEQPRAMLVDEKGVGYVTTRGDFVGRADVVRTGGAENLAVTVNWRVDRIRENEVVLARDDPSGPNRPPLTMVIPLRTEEDDDEG